MSIWHKDYNLLLLRSTPYRSTASSTNTNFLNVKKPPNFVHACHVYTDASVLQMILRFGFEFVILASFQHLCRKAPHFDGYNLKAHNLILQALSIKLSLFLILSALLFVWLVRDIRSIIWFLVYVNSSFHSPATKSFFRDFMFI